MTNRYTRIAALTMAIGLSLPSVAAEAERTSGAAEALVAALATNADYCQQWLEGKDYETLQQTAAGIALLADALERHGQTKPWQEAVQTVRETAGKLEAAARAESEESCVELIAALREAEKNWPRGAAENLAQANGNGANPSANLRTMMALLEGTHADAKRALLFGEPGKAKKTAFVLAELGEVLSNYRSDGAWKDRGAAFVETARNAARLPSDEPAAVRNALRGVYRRCEACHNRR